MKQRNTNSYRVGASSAEPTVAHVREVLASVMLLVGSLSAPALAATAADLGVSLTPSGAEKQGSKDGAIPAWKNEKQDASDWVQGKSRKTAWKYKDDKVLYSIDATNLEKYRDHLTPGEVALVTRVPGVHMDVYQSRRSCGVPDFVAENTKKNSGTAKIGSDGWSLAEAMVPGYPFPIPANGVEAMWNMKMRYRGVGIEFQNISTLVSPRRGSEDWIAVGSTQTLFYPWGKEGTNKLSSIGGTEFQTYFTYKTPAALAGQGLVGTVSVDKTGIEVFYYFPGQRRVRRMPSYAYDAPQIGFENQYNVDETQMFFGSLDRFNWKLIGKKEILVPYNVFGAYDFNAKTHDMAQRDYVANGFRRYEMHRVWVVEASVKQGSRHAAPKRVYYLDEDSWNAVLAEDYDAQGNLWKVREGYLIPVYETGTCDVTAFSQYNFAEGRYVVDFTPVGSGVDTKWYKETTSPKFKSDYYTAETLRSVSER